MLANYWKNSEEDKRFAFLFVLAIAFRFFFSIKVPLIDDEAYHWSWTKNLMLSYYDHPAMIAWLETLSTKIFGETYFGVRFPSFVAYVITSIMTWRLTLELFSSKAAHFVVMLFLLTPLWGLGGYVSSPEPPFMMFWILASWVFWQGYREDEKQWSLKKTWIWLGILMGLGLNSKFIIALLAPGFGIYILLTPHRRKDLLSPWPWVGFLIATIIAAPIFIWNLQYDWPGFRYQFHRRHAGQEFDLGRWVQFILIQAMFFSPVAYFLALKAFATGLKKRIENKWRFVFSLALPSFLVFYPQPMWSEYKPHWSGPAVLILMMGAGYLWYEKYSAKRWARWGLYGFLIAFNLFAYLPFAYPFMPKMYRVFGKEWKTTFDMSNEFYGWEEFGQFVNRRQREIHADTGKRPFISSYRYETTAQTYWGTKQRVYMLAQTRSHYTVTQTDAEMAALKGKDSLFISTEKYPTNPNDWAKWDSCTSEEFNTYRHQELARTFTLWYCKNFQGIK